MSARSTLPSILNMAVQKLVTRVLTPSGTALVPCAVPALKAEDEDSRYNTTNKAPGSYQSASPSGTVTPQDLPLYDRPQSDAPCPACQLEKGEMEDPSQLQQGISKVRKTVVSSVDSLKIEESKERVLGNVRTGLERAKAAYEYITNEENYLPRAAAITSGGLVGLLMARKGGSIKRIFYSSVGLTAMASVCYPKQAVIISDDLFKIGKYYAIVAYQKLQDAGKSR